MNREAMNIEAMNIKANNSHSMRALGSKLSIAFFACLLSVGMVPALAMAEEITVPGTQIEIADGAVPMSNLLGESTWAVGNLIIVAISVLFAAYMILRFLRSKSQVEKDSKRHRSGYVGCVLITVFAVIAMVMFFITEDFTLRMAFTDNMTLLMLIVIGWQFVIAAIMATNKAIEARLDVNPKLTVVRMDKNLPQQ